MKNLQLTKELLLAHCAAYPALQIEDLFKFLHQSVFGCGHFVSDNAKTYLMEELAALSPTEGPDVEPLAGDFCRVHLRALASTGLSPETLFRLFQLSGQIPCGSGGELEERLICLMALCREGALPFSPNEILRRMVEWGEESYPARHHSESFREAYHPAYRVIHKEFVRWLPLLGAIDRVMAKKGRAIVAIEGGAASGKTTLSTILEEIYGCTVFHMDDFFLRSEQRTPERLAEPGGNVDRERFAEEVLLPLSRGEAVRYRPYDCQTQTVAPAQEIAPTPLTIVEGAYSLHPELARHYDLSVFLRISPQLQRLRILMRNGSEMAERFFSTWIPMEQMYFDTFDTAARCDLILEVDE